MRAIRKFFFLFIFFLLSAACSSENNVQENLNEQVESGNQEPAGVKETEEKEEEESAMEKTKVKLTFENEEVIVQMENTTAAQDFLSLLPLTLTIEDYAGTEKVSYLPRKLATEGAPDGVEASRGDFTYYAPWGNIAIFYRDFKFSNGLIKLGTVESGIEKLESINGNFQMVIEKATE